MSGLNTSRKNSPNTSLSRKGKSPRMSEKNLRSSMKSDKKGGEGSLLSSGRRSPSLGGGNKKNSPSIPSSRKSPLKNGSPRKIIMGAGMAPNSKPNAVRRAKDKSLDLDLGNMTGTIIMSA